MNGVNHPSGWYTCVFLRGSRKISCVVTSFPVVSLSLTPSLFLCMYVCMYVHTQTKTLTHTHTHVFMEISFMLQIWLCRNFVMDYSMGNPRWSSCSNILISFWMRDQSFCKKIIQTIMHDLILRSVLYGELLYMWHLHISSSTIICVTHIP